MANLIEKVRWLFLIVVCLTTDVIAADVLRIALIAPMSGTFSEQGESNLRHARLAIEEVNARGGVLGGRILDLTVFDGQVNVQDSVVALQKAIDQGIRYVIQGNGSSITLALRDAIEKHNLRNPERSVLLLNVYGNDPALINERCSFWHFRFDAGINMKMQALTNFVAKQPEIRKVYLINQDYAYGQSWAQSARQMLNAKRPDIQIVGDERHPLGKVKDFSPYTSRIAASGADTVMTGNWGSDLVLLVKSGNDAGLRVNYLTYWANIAGTPAGMGSSAIGHVKTIAQWFSNLGSSRTTQLVRQYHDRFPDSGDDLISTTHFSAMGMLAQAIDKARSTDPYRVALALEGMRWLSDTGEVEMRADNHQLVQPLFIATFAKSDGKDVKFDADRTGNGFRIDFRLEGRDTLLPSSCNMQRP